MHAELAIQCHDCIVVVVFFSFRTNPATVVKTGNSFTEYNYNYACILHIIMLLHYCNSFIYSLSREPELYILMRMITIPRLL